MEKLTEREEKEINPGCFQGVFGVLSEYFQGRAGSFCILRHSVLWAGEGVKHVCVVPIDKLLPSPSNIPASFNNWSGVVSVQRVGDPKNEAI